MLLKEIPMASKGFNDVSCLTTLLLLCSEAKEVSNRDLCTWFGVKEVSVGEKVEGLVIEGEGGF